MNAPAREALRAVSIAIAALIVALALVEIGVRIWCTRDADGNYFVRGGVLPPLRLPVATTREKVRRYLHAGSRTALTYDSLLGWAPRPNGRSRDGLYQYNSQSIRSPRETDLRAGSETIRIGLFGDSFVHGDEVPFDATIGCALERRLRREGLDVEVLNFGVGGYGTDQAFLRWRALGRQFSPRIVIQGLHMENVGRNVNVVRPIYYLSTGIALAKPRFILDGGQLELVNVPPIPPLQLPEAIAELASSPLAAHEYFLPPYLDDGPFWLGSKAIALLVQRFRRSTRSVSFDLGDEPARLMLGILEQFRREVEAEGAQFVAVHLPDASDLRLAIENRRASSSALLGRIGDHFDTVLPQSRLLEHARASAIGDLFVDQHYSAKGNELVAAEVAAHLRPRLQPPTWQPRGAPRSLPTDRALGTGVTRGLRCLRRPPWFSSGPSRRASRTRRGIA